MRVILDSDLSAIYGVKTKVLNQAVKRNKERFPTDFAFQLQQKDLAAINNQHGMRSQIVTASKRNIRFLPFVFTEHGALMASNVLKSSRALSMSIYVVRAFIRLREAFALHKDLAQKLSELERKIQSHDAELQAIVQALRQLMEPQEKPKREIGFRVKESLAKYNVK
jgi:L-2-hydroxyglutarate oxidase LhgO